MKNQYEFGESPSDTLTATLLLAVAVHAFIILGVTFSNTDSNGQSSNLPTLDITMVPDQSISEPDDPDFLANENQQGSGNPNQNLVQQELDAHQRASMPAEETSPTSVLTAKNITNKTRRNPKTVRNKNPHTSAAQLIENSLAMAGDMDQQAQKAESSSDQSKHTYVSSRTRKHLYASYMTGWVAKVERVGNLNYPDSARRKSLSGTLLLDVALNPDGSILEIKLLRSSGQRLLDDAAIRIVQLAAPFSPFPPDIRKETDILHITRTWEFMETNQLKGK